MCWGLWSGGVLPPGQSSVCPEGSIRPLRIQIAQKWCRLRGKLLAEPLSHRLRGLHRLHVEDAVGRETGVRRPRGDYFALEDDRQLPTRWRRPHSGCRKEEHSGQLLAGQAQRLRHRIMPVLPEQAQSGRVMRYSHDGRVVFRLPARHHNTSGADGAVAAYLDRCQLDDHVLNGVARQVAVVTYRRVLTNLNTDTVQS